MVLSKNEFNGEIDYKKVTQTFTNETKILVCVNIDGEIIKCTMEHPFWVVGKGWTAACDLLEAMKVIDSNGHIKAVAKVEVEELDQVCKVYNFEVDYWHTYFVGTKKVLVHNACKADIAQINALAKKYNINRDILGQVIHKEKKALHMRPNENLTKMELDDLAKSIKQGEY